jgi:WD40 repeat protein/tRNA A-37 threonylcarbamoyl transferase component Bud32
MSLQAESEVRTGMLIGEYQVTGVLGEGGMGTVYSAVHPVIGKRVAIKVLKKEINTQQEWVDRFVLEARSVNQISHENIIDVFAFGQLPGGQHYFVMEHLDGESLEDRMERDGHLTVTEALPIVRQIANALDAAHEHGIVHRDLKPDNVFLIASKSGATRVKVLDFGIAKLAGNAMRQKTRTGVPIGTPLFMSPEQCKGMNVDHRTDVYSFGVLVHHILTGHYPIDAESIVTLIYMHTSEPPKLPSLFGAPKWVDPIVQKALAKNADARYQRLGEMVDALEANLGKRRADPAATSQTMAVIPTAAVPSPSTARIPSASLPGPTPIPRVVPPTTPMAAISGASVRQKAIAPGTAVDASAPTLFRGHQDKVRHVRFAPYGLVLASASADHTVRLWDASGVKDPKILSGHTDVAHRVAFSPDGRLLASCSSDRTVRLWDVVTGAEVRVLRGHEGVVSDLAFSPDGTSVASASSDQTLRVWNVQTGHSTTLRGHRAAVMQVVYSPDGTTLASASDDQTVRLWDLNSGQRRILEGHTSGVCALTFSPSGTSLASSSHDRSVRLWYFLDDECRDYPIDRGTIWHVAFSPGGHWLASAAADNTVRVLEIDKGQPTPLRGHDGGVWHIAWSPDGKILASSSSDRTLRLWSTHKKTCLSVIPHEGAVRSAAFSEDGRFIATACDHPTVTVIRTPEIPEEPALESVPPPVVVSKPSALPQPKRHRTNLAVPIGMTVVSAVAILLAVYLAQHTSTPPPPKITKQTEPSSKTNKQVLSGHEGTIVDVAFLGESGLVSASEDGTLRVWNLHGDKDTLVLRAPNGTARNLSLSADGKVLASLGGDGTIDLWQFPGARPLKTLAARDVGLSERAVAAGVRPVLFSPDSRSLAVAEKGGTLRLVALDDFSTKSFSEHDASIEAMRFSADSSQLLSAGQDGTVRLFGTYEGKQRAKWRSPDGTVHDVAFGKDASPRWATVEGSTVRLSRTGGGGPSYKSVTETQLLSRPTPLGTVRFSPDGETLAASSDDSAIQLWDVSSGKPQVLGVSVKDLRHLTFTADGKNLVFSGSDHSVNMVHLPTSAGRMLYRHGAPVTRVEVSSLSGDLASGSADRNVMHFHFSP